MSDPLLALPDQELLTSALLADVQPHRRCGELGGPGLLATRQQHAEHDSSDGKLHQTHLATVARLLTTRAQDQMYQAAGVSKTAVLWQG